MCLSRIICTYFNMNILALCIPPLYELFLSKLALSFYHIYFTLYLINYTDNIYLFNFFLFSNIFIRLCVPGLYLKVLFS